LCERVRTLPLTHLHVFPYSDRPGTVASTQTNKVEGAVIRERGRTIRDIGAALTRAFRQSQQGREYRALTLDDGWSAVTPNYLKVQLDRQLPRNEWAGVRLVDAESLRATVMFRLLPI
jgi:threonylcarbamoyladenosine tRNA methylthiotransferase MtaB